MTQIDPAQLGGWHLDKRVPIALIITLFLQTTGIVWWAATINSRVDVNENHIKEMAQKQNEIEKEVISQGREDISISQQLSATNAALQLLRQDVRETNTLLRGLLNNGGHINNGGNGG